MRPELRSAAAIVGFGDAYANADNRKTANELAVEAAVAAIGEAGIRKQEIGGVFTSRKPLSEVGTQWNNIMSAHLQLTPDISTEVTSHGSGANGMLGYAAIAVNSGVIDYALCMSSDAGPLWNDLVADTAELDADPIFEAPYGPSIPSLYAQGAIRYAYEFDVTEEDFAQVAVTHQRWGVHHPHAAKRSKGDITIEDVLASPLIADPIRRWNAAMWGPGGSAGAFIVTTAERAADLVEDPIYIRGFGGCNTHEYVTDRLSLVESHRPLGALPNLTHTGAIRAAQKAYDMAELTPTDIGSVQCGNNFTHVAMMLMEDLGFAEKGNAKELVWSGRLDPGGDLPWNTNGGWLSFGQNGISSAVDPIVEGIRQMRGNALGLQLDKPGHVLTHALGGIYSCHAVTILSHEK